MRLASGNVVEIHRTGASGIDAMLAAIAGARTQIHLETYILRADETGHRFFSALEEKARTGVEVRFLYDDFGARGVGRRELAPLHAAGVEVAVFNPLRRMRPRLRDHRKILVVDGEVGFTGGLNVSDECYRGLRKPGGPWRDLHLGIRGPAVQDLDRVFAQCWGIATGSDVVHWSPAAANPAAGDAVLGVLPDGPTGCPNRLRDVLCRAIEGASRSALFVSPYFIPGAPVLAAMRAAVARGVAVDVLVAGTNDHATVAWAMRSLLRSFLEAGVRIWEFHGALMHAKAAIFDAYRAVVGTSNFDQQSFHYSYEVNLVAVGGELPRRLEAIVREDLARSSPLTADTLARRSRLERARDRASAFIVEKL